MKPNIIKNLFLSVDFVKSKKILTIGKSHHNFYLIGTLPVLLIHENGEKEIAKLKDRQPIRCDDPYLRKLIGVRAVENKKYIQKYKEQISQMVLRLEQSIKKVEKTKLFAGKKIEKLGIIAVK